MIVTMMGKMILSVLDTAVSYTHLDVYKRQTEYRINEACKLLRAGNLSIAEVAISVGFFDQFYFSRVFKRAKGCLLYTSRTPPTP